MNIIDNNSGPDFANQGIQVINKNPNVQNKLSNFHEKVGKVQNF